MSNHNPTTELGTHFRKGDYRQSIWVNGTTVSGGAGSRKENWYGPLDCLRILRRRTGTLVLITLAGVAAAALTSLMQPRMYRSGAALEIQGFNENFLNLRDVDPSAAPVTSVEPYVKTEAEILQQDAVIQQTAKKLKLGERPEYRAPTGLWARITHPSPSSSERYAREAVKKSLRIEPFPDSQIVQVQFEARDPKIAADFVNTLAETAIERSVDERRRAAQQVNEWLRPRIQELKSRLADSETALDAYTRGAGLILTEGQENLAADKLRTMQDELSRAQADRITKQAQLAQAGNGMADGMVDDSTIRDYEIKLTDLRRQLADLSSILQPESYKITRLQAQITQLESAVQTETQRLRHAAQADFLAAQRRERDLAAACAQQAAVVSGLNSRMTHYSSLKHDVDSNRQFYDAMLQKVNEAGIASAVRESNIRLAAPAEPPIHPYKPNWPLNLTIGLFGGLVLAVGTVMLSEQANSRLRAPGEAGIYLNVPELGTIPHAQYFVSTARKLLGSRSGPVERVTWERRFSEVSEAFRGVAASIVSGEQNGDRRDVMVISSALPGEGKTTVACNLAIALAEIRGNVLLIDGDMRRPRLHKVFGVPNSWGLSDILGEQNAADELPLDVLAKNTGVPRLCLLPSGPCTDSIFSLLYSERMSRLMHRFRQEFDYVIADAPPCLEFADARILARHAAGVLLVLRANYADRRTALAAADRFIMDGIPIIGTILNHWEPAGWGDAYGYGSYRKFYQQTAS